MKFFRKCYEIVNVLAIIAVATLFLKILLVDILATLRPVLSPVVTILFVLAVTIAAFRQRITAILSIGGLSIYAASWLAVSVYGVYIGMAVCTFGIAMWLVAPFLPSFKEIMPAAA